MNINIIGAGLAGCEAAVFLADRDYTVNLYEMKPTKYSPAHTKPGFAELVCSNSLKSISLSSGHGLLKREMELFASLTIEAAKNSSVPAGQALAVDRDIFTDYITNRVRGHKNINLIYGEITDIEKFLESNSGITIIATGPLTSDALSDSLKNYFDNRDLFFFDAAAPIVSTESLDLNKLFYQSRYGKGEADYLNSCMDRDLYYRFVDELIKADKVTPRDFEDKKVFEGCMPVESVAQRGVETLAFGPMKPVGIASRNGYLA